MILSETVRTGMETEHRISDVLASFDAPAESPRQLSARGMSVSGRKAADTASGSAAASVLSPKNRRHKLSGAAGG